MAADFLQSDGRAVSGTNSNSLVFREWHPVSVVYDLRPHHPVSIVYDQSNAGSFTGVFDVVRLVNVDNHLQPYITHTDTCTDTQAISQLVT